MHSVTPNFSQGGVRRIFAARPFIKQQRVGEQGVMSRWLISVTVFSFSPFHPVGWEGRKEKSVKSSTSQAAF